MGPSEGEETGFLAEQHDAQRMAAGIESPVEKEADGALPPLEELVNRIPVPTRALVEELFRAKFVTVKRVPESALKG